MGKFFLQLLAEALEKDKGTVKITDKFREYEEWQSLSLLVVLTMIEQEYGLIIPRVVFEKIQTVEDLYNYISRQLQSNK